jgi:hypothetical protein
MKIIIWRLLVLMTGLTAFILACSPASLPTAGVDGETDTALLRDDFSADSTGWGTGTNSDSSVEYTNGGLQFIVFSERYLTWSNPNAETYSNVHVEVTVRNESPDRLAIYGILCHGQADQSFYYLGVASDGYYTISKAPASEEDFSLTNGSSPLVPIDSEPFTIGADCGTGTLTLYINGQQIATAQDSSYTSGKVGLFAKSNETADSVDVIFDDFVVTLLQ